MVCATNLYAQTFSVPQKEATIRVIFDALRQQAGISYSASDVGAIFDKSVPAGFKDLSLTIFLGEYLPGYGLSSSYDSAVRIILLWKKGERQPVDAGPRILKHIMGIVLKSKPAEGETGFLPRINVQIKGTGVGTMTDNLGAFSFDKVPSDAILVVTAINMEPVETGVTDSQMILIRMDEKILTLNPMFVNNGLEQRRRETTTGSYNVVSQSLLERSTGPDLMSRTENKFPGVLDNRGGQGPDGSSLPEGRIVRGRATINGDGALLVIVDDFPYDGLTSSINPDDVESVTILKDAAATAIWGARAGNGVMVITTKKGKSDRPRVEVHASYGVQRRPDLWYPGLISSSDYIELEKNMYRQGYYDQNFGGLGTINYAPVTPVVELLHSVDQGLISPAQADAQIAAMKGIDVRNDAKKYMYQNALTRQGSVQVSGRKPGLNYFGSAGYDNNTGNLVGVGYSRVTGRVQITDTLKKWLQVYGGASYTGSWDQNGNNPGMAFQSAHGGKSFYPYYRLKDDQGQDQPFFGDYSRDYLRQAGSAGFLPWTDDPVGDIDEEKHVLHIQDYVLDLGLRFRLLNRLHLDVKYKVERQDARDDDYHSDSSYFTRDLINKFIQVDPVTGLLSYPIPPGGIRDWKKQVLISHQARVQLNYQTSWGDLHDVSILGGVEGKSMVTSAGSGRQYGVQGSKVATSIDDSSYFSPYLFGETTQIPIMGGKGTQTDHLLSAYLSGHYIYRDRYIFSASGRMDAANLFGATTNDKGTPLWSVGGSWRLNKEDFFTMDWLPRLMLRVSTGTAGNFSRKATAFTLVSTEGNGITGMGYPTASITGLPNERLRWELVRITNVGLDFATRNELLSGTVEYYQKRGTDLLANVYMDPTLGGAPNPGERAFSYKNSAGTRGEGVDAELVRKNLNGKLKWTTHLIFSYAVSRVTNYSYPDGPGKDYLNSNVPNPVVGKPLYAVYSYAWRGLDGQTGDPRGVGPDGKTSSDWTAITDSTPLKGLIYHGPAEPTVFGALRNEFTLGAFSLSFNISFKGGYYFRKPALRYDNLLNTWTGPDSYRQRWQKPGDEKFTSVPSFKVEDGSARDLFYAYSAVNVARADNIRLEDVNLSYEKKKIKCGEKHFADLVLFLYCSNLGLLWAANKDGIDPYYSGVARDNKRCSIGLKLSF